MGREDPEYYPLRWKFADAVEDLLVLHRRKLVIATLLLLGGVAVGIFLSSGGDDDVETAGDGTSTTQPETTETTEVTDTSDSDGTSSTTVVSTTTTTAATTSTTANETTTTVAETTTVPESTRPVPTPEQIAAAQPGAIIEMSPDVIRLVGGLPTDAAANDTIRVVEQVFPGAEVLDEQIVDDSFDNPDSLVFRLSAADLFGYNSDDLNPTYLPLIDQLAATMIDASLWSVEVVGHTDDVGPAGGNQALSERRARSGADRLIAEGVDADRVSVVGRGEDEPIADNGTEAGRLANRRIEFVITEG